MPPTSPHSPGLHPRGSGPLHRPRAGRAAAAVLGAGHPLVGVLYACGATIESVAAVGAIQVGALALWWVNASYARALTVGAALVQLALGLRWATLRVQRRDLCLELLVTGGEYLALAELARERGRLGNRHRQAQLATSLEQLAADATRKRSRCERHRPIYSRRVLAAVEPELCQIVARLRAGDPDVRGVALIDRLVTSGTSPLYGEQPGALHEELARGRYLLS